MYKIKRTLYMIVAISILLGMIPYGVNATGTEVEKVDKVKPSLDYAYVQDGMLRLIISDNSEEFDRRPIYFKAEKELRYYYIEEDDYEIEYDDNRRKGRYYEIEVEIPSKITILIKDKAGNESSYNLTIKEDNAPVTKNIPIFILERLNIINQSEVDTFSGFDNIFELEYGKIIDAIAIYDDTIKDNYLSYNKNDIKFKLNGLTMDKTGNIKLDKYGIFPVTMTHSNDKTFNERAYILIKPDWRNPEDRRLPVNISPYIVYGDKIKPIDYFKYDDEVAGSKNKSKVDASYMLVYDEDSQKTYTMSETIPLELNKIYNLNVLNFEDNSLQNFYIMRQEKVKVSNRNFSDIDKGHWASKDISSLVSKGLISGYPNGRFEPSGNITVKEFMTILSRYIATSPKKGKPIVGDVIPLVPFGEWGYIESKSVLDRISSSELYRFDYMGLDRLITREEAAFLIDKTLELGLAYNPNVNSQPKDIGRSKYPSEVSTLVDLGLISGYPDGTFRPNNNITRAEAVAVFARIK